MLQRPLLIKFASLTFITLLLSTFSEQSCTPRRFYCGSQLPQVSQRVQNTTLWQCDPDGKSLTISYTCTSGCKVVHEGDSYCQCLHNKHYCGQELNDIGWQTNENSLYHCINEGLNASLIQTCTNNCKAASHSQSYCFRQCEDGKNYCGYELRELGLEGYEHNSLYRCRDGKEASGSKVVWIASCNNCYNRGIGAHCDCTPGVKYCGSQLNNQMGYQGYNNNSIYLCDDALSPLVGTEETNILCSHMCIPGHSYCGHELYEHYNSMETKLDHNYIYKCSETTSTVIEQERCRKCFRLYGEPICTHGHSSWYWFAGGIAAGLVPSFGLLFFICNFLKHRRLKQLMGHKIIDLAQLSITNILGEGQFGKVLQGTYTDSMGNFRNVAVKVSKGRIDATNCFQQEVMTLDIVSHENIIMAFGICLNFEDQYGNTVPALVLEYINGGSAISYMRSERNRLNGRDLLRIFVNICQAGDHLCKLGIIHRDIAARNVLVQEDLHTGHVIVAKLTDFGLAKDIRKLGSMYKDTNHDQTMPFRYMAPEGFERCFCLKSDVWSFGVFMWELYTVMEEEDALAQLRLEQGRSGPMPYSELDMVSDVLAEASSGRKLKQPRTAPEKMYRIMLHCWATKPESRPAFEELIYLFNIHGNGNIIEPRVTFLPTGNSEKKNGSQWDKENNHEEMDKQHDQDTYASP